MAKKSANKLYAIIAAVVGVVALIVVAMLFLFKGPSDEQTVTYERVEEGVTMRLTYYARGDKVYKQTARNVIPYEALGVDSKEDAEEILDSLNELVESTRGIKGYEDTFKLEDDAIIETVSIDYEVVDINEVKNLIGAYFEGDTENGISLSKSIEWLEESGFTEVKP